MEDSKRTDLEPCVKVVVVDDHPATREGLAICISMEPDLEVCGQAADVAEAIQVIQSTQPDIVIVDVSLKTGDGIDLVKRLLARNESLRILVWSMYGEELYARRALSAGALGYVNKQNDTRVVIDAIRTVLQGQVYLSPQMTTQMLKQFSGGPGPGDPSSVEILSDRELEVFRLIGSGRTTQQIARELHLSVKTVETYRGRIKEKLNVTTPTHLIQRATQWVLENG